MNVSRGSCYRGVSGLGYHPVSRLGERRRNTESLVPTVLTGGEAPLWWQHALHQEACRLVTPGGVSRWMCSVP